MKKNKKVEGIFGNPDEKRCEKSLVTSLEKATY